MMYIKRYKIFENVRQAKKFLDDNNIDSFHVCITVSFVIIFLVLGSYKYKHNYPFYNEIYNLYL